MENNNFCEELSKMFNTPIYETPTIEYQLNGFFESCGIELENNIELHHDDFASIKKDEKYDIDIMNVHGKHGNKSIYLKGKYDDLSFEFLNTFKERRIKNNQILEIPFSIHISKIFEKNEYEISIYSNMHKTNVILKEERSQNDKNVINFYTKRIDIENVFGLLHTFLNNPQLVFNMYKEILNSKKIYFNGVEFDSVKYDDKYVNDENGKLLRKIK